MTQKQINLKVDSQLFAHLCKKSQRNNLSNPEFIRQLIEEDMKKPSEGDKELLNRYGSWAAKTTAKQIINDIESSVAVALKSPFDKYQVIIKDFIKTVESSNKRQFNETASLIGEIRSLSKELVNRNNSEIKVRKNQFITLYCLLGGNLLIQGILFLKWLFS